MTTIVKRLGVIAFPVILQSLVAEPATAGFNDPIGKIDDIFIYKIIRFYDI